MRIGPCSTGKGARIAAPNPNETTTAKSGPSNRFAIGAMRATSPNAGQVKGSVKSCATMETPKASQALDQSL